MRKFTLLITHYNVNIWRYLRNCNMKRVQLALLCEVEILFIFWYEKWAVL